MIFVHLNKTGGTTLRRILFTEYGPLGVLNLDYLRSEDELAAYKESEELQASVRAIAGHIGFGLGAELDRAAHYITMLREPVERVVSHHAYIRRQPDAGSLKGITLEDFLIDDRASLVHNLQTCLLGTSQHNEGRVASRSMLETAKENLERHFAVVGLSERFDESLMLMRRALVWRVWPFYEPANVSPKRPRVADVRDDLVAHIIERNNFDIELYQWAAQRFQRAVDDAGVRFRVEAAAFRKLNSPFGERLRASASLQRKRAARLPRIPRKLGRLVVGR